MMPYILSILHNSGTPRKYIHFVFVEKYTNLIHPCLPEDVISICEKLPQFSTSSEIPEGDLKSPTEEALEEALRMGLIRRNARNKTYTLANKWFLPETQSFQLELQEIVRNMPQTLAAALDPANQDVPTSSNHPMDCMGPGMTQRRSPAQIRAIAIYRRMREQREREEREAAARSRKRRNSRSRSRSRSGARRTRRASTSTSRARPQSKRRSSSRSRSRSTARNRSTSRSRRR